jgi:hypothetical protein
MKCRQCGTDIAEKALICYRCGTATTEAKFKPVPIGRRGLPASLWIGLATAAAAVAAVLYTAC